MILGRSMFWPFRLSRPAAPPPEAEPEPIIALVDDTVDPRLVVYHEPAGLQSEQYRSFRTNLRAMNPGDQPRTLLFTSAQPREGKTLTVANIALALAECSPLRVALVDADLRSGRLHRLLGLPGAPGLSDVLADRVPPRQALQSGKVPNLSFMAAGRAVDSPGELLGGDYMQELIGWLKRDHNYVLFDSPPCLAFADAGDLATVIDGVVLIVAIDETARTDAERAIAQLKGIGANVVGTFVSGSHPLPGAGPGDPYADESVDVA